MNKPVEKEELRDDTAALIAEVYGVSPGYVRRIVKGDRYNPTILQAYIQFKEGKNLLIEAIKSAVPLNTKQSA